MRELVINLMGPPLLVLYIIGVSAALVFVVGRLIAPLILLGNGGRNAKRSDLGLAHNEAQAT